MTLKLNIILNLHYVSSSFNDVDAPSRFSSDIDCSLSDNAWSLVETSLGPHNFDMLAIPSSSQTTVKKLRFFPPHPVAESTGVNVFSQNLLPNENYYAFPPFVLIGSLVNIFKYHNIRVTLIAPDLSPRNFWWLLLNSLSRAKVKIGSKGDSNVLIFLLKSDRGWHSRLLLWDLYAFRLMF